MNLDALYKVIVDNIDIQVWCGDKDTFKDGIIYEGTLCASRKVVGPYMYNRIFQIEVDDYGKLYIGIEVD